MKFASPRRCRTEKHGTGKVRLFAPVLLPRTDAYRRSCLRKFRSLLLIVGILDITEQFNGHSKTAHFWGFCSREQTKFHRILFSGSRFLQIQLFEDAFGDGSDNEHDGLPLEGDVQHILVLVDRADDGLRDRINIGKLLALRHGSGHGSPGGAWLDCEDSNTFAVDAVAQPREKGGEARLGGAIEV